MAYTTYQFYKNTYGGAMDEADFCRYAARAGYVLESLTQNRVKTLYPDPAPADANAIAMAMGAVLDGLAREEQTGGRTVVLEAVGKHRIGYATTVQNAAKSLRSTVAPFLRDIKDAHGVPLMDRCIPGSKRRRA